jgi:hypothetical protein
MLSYYPAFSTGNKASTALLRVEQLVYLYFMQAIHLKAPIAIALTVEFTG